jgi:POT family proton-dependent oligopeptide transporter
VIGGAIGDRWLGRRASVILGGLLMTAGPFSLAFDNSFLLALLLLILGAGLLRGNLPAQVKSLYADGDRRSADAFQIYYVGINLGAFIAPIVTGALAKYYSWHLGFGFAGFGMLIGLVLYLLGSRHLPREARRSASPEAAQDKIPLTSDERRRLIALLLLCPLITCFWIAQSQVWNVYNLWVRDHLDIMIGAFEMPIPWLQSLDGLSPILVMPIFLALWRRQAKTGSEPDDLGKMAIGCLIFGGACAWLALAPFASGEDGRAPLLWAVAFHLSSDIGWLYLAPIAMAFFAVQAPARLRGTMLGVNYLNAFFGSVISGRIGGLYEQISPTLFWLLHAAIVAGGGLCLLASARPLRHLLRPTAEAGTG